MKTYWEWSVRNEALRLIHLAHQIAVGFYGENGFIVLPSGTPRPSKNAVLFPDVGLERIPGFWERARRATISRWPVSRDEDLIGAIVRCLQVGVPAGQPDLTVLQDGWKKHSAKIIRQCEIVTGVKITPYKLFIYPSNYGTPVSFNTEFGRERAIQLFFRNDGDMFTLVEGVLSAVLKERLIVLYNASWRERELVVDYLVHSSAAGALLRKISPESEADPTTELIQKREYTGLKRKSEAFLKKLRVPKQNTRPIRSSVFSLYQGAQKLTNLSWKERRVLMMLGAERGVPVDFDRIAEIIFRNEDHYSLYALAKFISRLREKLEENGIPGNIIETVRKRGYVLK